MKKKLFIAAALLGVSLVSSTASSSSLPRYCDTACPTANYQCVCPPWSDKPNTPSFCLGWNRVGGCFYG